MSTKTSITLTRKTKTATLKPCKFASTGRGAGLVGRLAPLRQTLRNRGVFLFLEKSQKIFIKTLAFFVGVQYTKNTTNVRTKEQAMKKLTAKDINNIKIFAEAGYAIQASEWTSGRGRYTRRKATPVFTDEYNREDFKHALETGNNKPQWDTPERTAFEFFEKNPRARKVLVMDFNQILEALKGAEIK
nr:MAG TPA: hypothetical protein [Caudoviricetes sp.]